MLPETAPSELNGPLTRRASGSRGLCAAPCVGSRHVFVPLPGGLRRLPGRLRPLRAQPLHHPFDMDDHPRQQILDLHPPLAPVPTAAAVVVPHDSGQLAFDPGMPAEASGPAGGHRPTRPSPAGGPRGAPSGPRLCGRRSPAAGVLCRLPPRPPVPGPRGAPPPQPLPGRATSRRVDGPALLARTGVASVSRRRSRTRPCARAGVTTWSTRACCRSTPTRLRHGVSTLGTGTRLSSERSRKHRKATLTWAAAITSRSESLAWHGRKARVSLRTGSSAARPMAGLSPSWTRARPFTVEARLDPPQRVVRGHQRGKDHLVDLRWFRIIRLFHQDSPPRRLGGCM